MKENEKKNSAISSILQNLDRRWLLILALAVLALILFIWLIFIQPKPIASPEEGKAIEKLLNPVQKMDFDSLIADRCYPLGDRLLLLRPETVVLQELHGQEIASLPLDLAQPVGLNVDGYVLCGDRKSERIDVFNHEGIVFESSLDGSLAGGDYNRKGIWAVIDDVGEKPAKVHLLDSVGERVFTLSFDQSGSPLKLSFTPDGNALDILILNSSGSQLKTYVKRFDLAGEQLAQRVLEGYPVLFTDILHDRSGNPVVYSGSTVIHFAFENSDFFHAYEFARVEAVIPHAGNLLAVGSEIQDGKLSIYELNQDGNRREMASGLRDAERFLKRGNQLFISASSTLYRYRIGGEEFETLGALDGQILTMSQVNGRQVNILTHRGARIIDLP